MIPEGYESFDQVLRRFRTKHPDGTITTTVLELGGRLICRAEVRADDRLLSSAHKELPSKTAYSVEKMESGSVRRALLHAGFGRSGEDDVIEDATTPDEYRDAMEDAPDLTTLQRIATAIARRHPALAAGELHTLRTVFEARRGEILSMNQENA